MNVLDDFRFWGRSNLPLEAKLNQFPDGQIGLSFSEQPIHLEARVKTSQHLDLYLQSAISGIKTVSLYPYGGRSDRLVFHEGEWCTSASELIDYSDAFEPHSGPRAKWSDIIVTNIISQEISRLNIEVVVLPDFGAFTRYSEILKSIGVEVRSFGKARNGDKIEIVGLPVYKRALVMDDLCDGGGTFKALRPFLEGYAALYVSHGVFSKGVQTLLDSYDNVITTNSYQDFVLMDRLKVYEVFGNFWNGRK